MSEAYDGTIIDGVDRTNDNSLPGQAYLTWQQAWRIALTQPYFAFYEALGRNTSISTRRALVWIFVGGIFQGVAAVARQVIYQGSTNDNLPLGLALCYGPLVVASFIITLAITNGIARAVGGQGSFAELVRPVAAFAAPLMIINSMLSLIPCIFLATYGLVIYELGLTLLSVRTVHRIGWGWATVACGIQFLFTAGSFLSL